MDNGTGMPGRGNNSSVILLELSGEKTDQASSQGLGAC